MTLGASLPGHTVLLDADNLPEPDVVVDEIAEDLRNALEQIEQIQADLRAPQA